MACTPTDPVSMESGQTTTTYSGTNSSSSSDDGDPSDVTDDGEVTTDDGDPSDSDTDDPWPGETDDGSNTGGWDFGGNPGGAPNGMTCVSDDECSSGNCYVVPFLGGQCGECNEDDDCDGGGCTPPNPFQSFGSLCNMGEAGGGCESDEVCADGLSCATALDLLGLIQINTCGPCQTDLDCGDWICAPIVDLGSFGGQMDCIVPESLPQDSYCNLEGNGTDVCQSGICSTVDIQGLAQIGACGQCNTDNDCDDGVCTPGEFLLDAGTLTGSTCN